MFAVTLIKDNLLDEDMVNAIIAMEKPTYEERFPELADSEVYHVGTLASCDEFIANQPAKLKAVLTKVSLSPDSND